jgi:NhaA family Na+:H+ antiporter
LPVAAAVGGMLVPALLYAVLNASGEGASGWGIPMATDIAFALGVLAVFGKRVPIGLKVFLTALAIADDLGAVLVIALFYTAEIRVGGLIAAAVFLILLLAAIRIRIKRLSILLPLIAGVWLGVFVSGVHATVAGILVAMVIPVTARIDPQRFLAAARERLERLETTQLTSQSMIDDQVQYDAIESLNECTEDMLPAGLRLEHTLHPVQVWFILPVFALANAGVTIDSHILEALANPISLGIMLGLIVGKPLGITLLSWLVVRLGRAELPAGVSWSQILGASCLAGIGFTMSLFIAGLAFGDEALVANAKVGILAASLISAVLGLAILSRGLPSARERS